MDFPKVVVPRRIIEAMADETLAHPVPETGQALFGIEVDLPWADSTAPSKIVLGVIPDLVGTVRNPGLFRQGGADQVEVMRWYQNHWEMMRKASGDKAMSSWRPWAKIAPGVVPAVMNRPLAHIGDWHKHPGNFDQPSGTDTHTVLTRILTDKPDAIIPILTFDPYGKMTYELIGPRLVLKQIEVEISILWYYMTRATGEQYFPIRPIIVEDDQLPFVPPLPWIFSNYRRMQIELNLLEKAGYTVRWATKELGGDPLIQEIFFAIDHPSWHSRLLVVTPWNYPSGQVTTKAYPKNAGRAEPPKAQANQQTAVDQLFRWLGRMMRGEEEQDLWRVNQQPVRQLQAIYLLDVVKGKEKELKDEEEEEHVAEGGGKDRGKRD